MKFKEMHDGDPFRSIAELCHVSSSQEEHLRRCRFAFQPDDESPLFADDSGEIPVASTGIMMFSAPENIEEQKNEDNASRDATAEVFRTPPEVSTPAGSSEEQLLQREPVESVEGVGNGERIEAVDGGRTDDDSVAVDLGRDTDLGFSLETELTEGITIDSGMISSTGVCRAHESEAIYSESTGVRVSKRKSTLNEGVCESPVKKSEVSYRNVEFESPGSGLGACWGKTLETIVKTMVKLKSPLNESKVWDKKLDLEARRDSLAAESEKTSSTLLKITGKLSPSAEKSKDLYDNMAMEALRKGFDTEKEKLGETLEESVDNTRNKVIDLPTHSSMLSRDYQSEEIVVEMHASSTESHGESSTKRRWEFSAGLLESRIQQIKEDARNKKNREGGVSNSKKDCEADQVCNSRDKNASRKSINKTHNKVIDLHTHSSKLPRDYQSEETGVEMHASSMECRGESSTKRKWEFSTGLLESRIQQIKEGARNKKNREGGVSNSKKDCKADQVCNSRDKNASRKSIDDIDKFRYVNPSDTLLCKTEKHAEGKRALPASVLGKESPRRGRVECDRTRSPKDYKEFTLLDILKMLSKDCPHDPSLEKLSLLEVAKRCGMTFP